MLIAGNWKMFKGPRETAAFCRELRDADLPDDVDVVVCPPYVSLADAVQALAGTEIGVFAQNCHWEHEGAFTGEVSRADAAASSASTARSSATPSAASSSARPTRPSRGARGRRSTHGLHVIACVGETRGRARGGRDGRGAPAAGRRCSRPTTTSSSPTSRCGRSAPGKTATPEMAQQAHEIDQVAARRAGALRRLGQAGERGRAARAARGRRRARRRRLARRRLVRGDLPGTRSPLVALVILDGWGCAPAGPGNAVELARHAGLRPALARRIPHTTIEASGEAAGLPPGQMGNSRGRPPDDRRRAAALPGSDARQQVDRGRLVLRQPGAARGVRARAARPPARPRLARRRPLAHRPPAGAAALRAGEDVDPRVHRRARRLADVGRARPRRAAARPHRHRRRPLLRDGPRPAAGSARSWRSTRSRDAPAAHGRATTCSRPCSGATTPASPTSSSSRSASRARRGIEPGDTVDLLQLPPRPRPAADADAARRRRRRDDDDPLRRPTSTRRSSFAEQDVAEHDRRGARRARAAAAARRRDGEVRPRDVLLQRRPRGRLAGRDARCSCRARATCRATTTSRRCPPTRSPTRVVDEIGDGYAFCVVNFANPDMVGHTGLDPGRDRGGRDGRPLPRPRRRARRPSSAVSA